MNLQQRIANNLALSVLGLLFTGFVAGWGTNWALQRASGMTQISTDRLSRLEREAANSSDPKRIDQLESQVSELQDQLLKNRPTG